MTIDQTQRVYTITKIMWREYTQWHIMSSNDKTLSLRNETQWLVLRSVYSVMTRKFLLIIQTTGLSISFGKKGGVHQHIGERAWHILTLSITMNWLVFSDNWSRCNCLDCSQCQSNDAEACFRLVDWTGVFAYVNPTLCHILRTRKTISPVCWANLKTRLHAVAEVEAFPELVIHYL